jgi:hypothetical protein
VTDPEITAVLRLRPYADAWPGTGVGLTRREADDLRTVLDALAAERALADRLWAVLTLVQSGDAEECDVSLALAAYEEARRP